MVVSGNPDKASAFLGPAERRDLVAAATRHLGNVRAVDHHGLTADLAVELDADFLVRGMGKEQVTEIEMAAANLAFSGLPTVFVPPDGATAWISSRHIRSEFQLHGADAVAALVPDPVLDRLRRDLRPSPA